MRLQLVRSTGNCSQPYLKIVNFVNELLVLGIHCSSRGNLKDSSIFKIDKVVLEGTEKRELIYKRDEEENYGKSPFWDSCSVQLGQWAAGSKGSNESQTSVFGSELESSVIY